jgi:phage-related protein
MFAAKPIVFLGNALDMIRAFPEGIRRDIGFELRQVQLGRDPSDWKPMKTIGPGVREIRVRDASGAFRVIYIATLADAVYVLHAFQKKTQATAQKDIDLAAARLKQI